jgi:hypothetical protein
MQQPIHPFFDSLALLLPHFRGDLQLKLGMAWSLGRFRERMGSPQLSSQAQIGLHCKFHYSNVQILFWIRIDDGLAVTIS